MLAGTDTNARRAAHGVMKACRMEPNMQKTDT